MTCGSVFAGNPEFLGPIPQDQNKLKKKCESLKMSKSEKVIIHK